MMEYGHGGDIYRNRNVELDFSVNVNPLGMPNFVWDAPRQEQEKQQRLLSPLYNDFINQTIKKVSKH